METCLRIIRDNGILDNKMYTTISKISKICKCDLLEQCAANTITRFFKKITAYNKQVDWINSCIVASTRKHFFPWRMQINIREFEGFYGGIGNWPDYENVSKFVKCNYTILCECGNLPVSNATYFSVGQKMFKSFPYLKFLCWKCFLRLMDDAYFEEFYQKPETDFYYEFKNCGRFEYSVY